jgi:hypothetical protein
MEFNDLYQYEAVTDHWTMLLPEGEKPQGRSGAAASLDQEGNLFIVGGYSSQGYLNDVWVYSTVSNKWNKFQTSGDAPTARELHSFTIQGKVGMLFGGFHAGGVSSELYVLDIEMMNWFKAKDDGYLPEGREGHVSLVSGDFLFVQGGCNFAHQTCFDDFFVLDLVSFWWVKLETHSFTTHPAQKERASSVSLGPEIIIFGGCFLDKHCFNDLIRINTGIKCNCNQQGVCRDGICVCYKGYSGHDCLVRPKCKENCLGRGFCSSSGECDCYPGYKGSICEYESNCPKNCTSIINGRCQTDGTCKCNEGYSGYSCQCECINGACTESGCLCEVGWSGTKCDIQELDSESIQSSENPSSSESQEASSSIDMEDSSSQITQTNSSFQQFIQTSFTPSQSQIISPCENCIHGECIKNQCFCSNGYTGENCDKMSKGVALVYASSLMLVVILAGGLLAYFCMSSVKTSREKEKIPLIA